MAKRDCEPRSEPIRAFCEVELAATLMSLRGRPVVIQSFEPELVVKSRRYRRHLSNDGDAVVAAISKCSKAIHRLDNKTLSYCLCSVSVLEHRVAISMEKISRESLDDGRAQKSCEHEEEQNPNDLRHLCLFQRWYKCDASARAEWIRDASCQILPSPPQVPD